MGHIPAESLSIRPKMVRLGSMSFRSLTAAVAMYRSGTLSLADAAERAQVTEPRFTAALLARGIPVREEDAVVHRLAG